MLFFSRQCLFVIVKISLWITQLGQFLLALASAAATTTTMAAPTDNPLAEYDSSESCDMDGSGDYQPTPAKREQKQIGPGVTASLLFNSNVSGALDRNKTSDRDAVRLMIPIAAVLGHDPSSLPLSRSTNAPFTVWDRKPERNLLKPL